MDIINLNYNSYTLCDSSFDEYCSVKCGKAGITIMFKKDLKFLIRIFDEIHDDKISGLELTLKNNTKLFFYVPICRLQIMQMLNMRMY